MAITIDTLDRLKSQLLTSGLQEKNQPLFQVISLLIDGVRQGFNEVNTQVFTPSGGGVPGGISNQTFLTFGPDSATLPNSAQVLAGEGIVFNKNGNKLIISTGLVRSINELGDSNFGTNEFIGNPGNTLAAVSFTAGSVIFAGPTGQFAQDNSNFFWDDTNNILRVGIIAGGTGVNDDLILRSTTGVGTTNSRVFIQSGNNGSVSSVEITGDDRGRVGIGTVSAKTVASPLQIYGVGADIGYLIDAEASLGAGNGYIKVGSAAGDANAQAGFSFSQTQNAIEWRMAVVGNEGNDMRWASGAGGASIVMYVKNSDGNLLLNNSRTWPTNGTKSLFLGDGTVPSGLTGQNIAGVYANDVGGTVQLFAINEADESTRLTWPAPQTYTITNVTTDRSYDANATTLDEIADTLGTLIDDLRNRGIVA